MPTSKRRVAVTLPDREYDELAEFAEKHDVSMAWLGRQAILEFMARYRQESLQIPLPLRTVGTPQGDNHAAR